MKTKKTVGLIVLADTQNRGLAAALQARGSFNIEKNKPETYAGASQLTAHGSIEKGESEIDALLREIKEELGEEFANIIKNKEQSFIKLNRLENEKISVANFGLRIAEEDLQKIKIDEQTGTSIRLISKDEIGKIRELKPSDRESGIIDKNEIAMFSDDIEAVKLAFKKLDK